MPIVIGLHGAKGSGKDYFFKAVRDAFPNLDVRKVAYADPIRHHVSRIFNLTTEDEYDTFKRMTIPFSLGESSPSRYATMHYVAGRQIVREIGMLMRSYDPSQFVTYVEQSIINGDPKTIWCITDVRFPNEVQSIRDQLGGTIVKIIRPGFQYDGHVTETELPDNRCDVIIDNSGTIDHYRNRCVDLVTSYLQTVSIQKEI